tara:strand:+ start:158 stop:526 length:369 start_codon:yes stop_codon:yes gene_type:complete
MIGGIHIGVRTKRSDMEEDTMGRIMPMFFGLFLFFFGLPFTLTPFMILGDGVIDPAYPFESLFIIVFTIPFLMAGLALNFFGLSIVWGGLVGASDPTPTPRELPPSTGEEDESDSDRWWTEE